MRLVIECELISESNEIIEIPFDYKRKILSLFKSVLEKNNSELKNKYYSENKKKDFTFACYLPIKEIKEEKISLNKNIIKIFFSTPDYEIFFDFYNSLRNGINKEYNFANNKIKILSINLVKERKIISEETTFKILSPLIIRDHNNETKKNWFYNLNEEKGREILKRNLVTSLQEKFRKEDLEKIEIIPLNIKKVISYYYNFKMEGSKGFIKIKAKKEILEYFYKAGIGSNHSAGYGYLEIV